MHESGVLVETVGLVNDQQLPVRHRDSAGQAVERLLLPGPLALWQDAAAPGLPMQSKDHEYR